MHDAGTYQALTSIPNSFTQAIPPPRAKETKEMSFQEALLALPPLTKGSRTHAIAPETAAEWASHHRVRGLAHQVIKGTLPLNVCIL